MANLYVILLSFIPSCLGSCTPVYGGEPCTYSYVPAPPGHTPPCARPGITYCEHPYNYPGQIIKNLLEKWKYDHSTLILNESQDDFNSYYLPPVEYKTHGYPGYMYSYPYDISNANGDKINHQSSYFPYTNRNVTSYDPGLTYYDDRKKYQYKPYGYSPKYTENIVHYPTPAFYNRGREPYGSNLQSNWWKRFGNRDLKKFRLLRKRREILNKERILLSQSLNNSTGGARTKRQSLGSSQQLCQARSNYIMPRAALNNKGNWMYVVNMPELDNNLGQLVKSEVCASQQCSGLCSLPAGATSRCEQKYVQKRLVALEGSGSNLYTDVFWFPSCCVCTISS